MKRKILAALVILLSGATFGFYWYRNSYQGHPDAPIYIVGLDGASWNLMEPLMRQGKLPNLRKLRDSGVYGNLKSAYPAHSAFLWTSIATGKVKEKHGIGDFVVKEEQGGITPATGNIRRVKAFWNMLTDKKIPVSVVNWWVTWPPEPINGVMVSDRYRLARYKELNMDVVSPRSLQDRVPFPVISKDRAAKEWKQYGLPELYDVTNDGRITAFDKALRAYPTYWCQDAAVWDASQYVLKNHPSRVFGVVFRIVDISSHFFWCFLPPNILEDARAKWREKKFTKQDEEKLDQEFTKIIGPVYSYADEIVGNMMKQAPAGSTFIVVSDHGFAFDKTSYSHTTQKSPPDGIIILSGGPYESGKKIQGATIYDVTPTLLYQLQLPVGKDFDGKVLASAFRPGFLSAHKLARIPTWETGNRAQGEKPIQSETDEETIEDLRALGYLQ